MATIFISSGQWTWRFFLMAFVKAVSLQEIPSGTGKEVLVNGKKIALFHVEGTVFALDNKCTHRDAPLAEGECHGTQLVCPWHGAVFDLTSGAALCKPATKSVSTYKVQIVDGMIEVDV